MPNSFLLTVIIITRNNHADVKSAIMKTGVVRRREVEVVVVDDGSNPPVRSYLPENLRRHPRIRIRETNRIGPGGARNVGLDQARGRWLAFLDGDDWLDGGRLLSALRRMDDTSLDVVLFDTRPRMGEPPVSAKEFERARVYYLRNPRTPKHTLSGQQLAQELWNRSSYLPNSGLYAVRQDFLDKMGLRFREEGLMTDNDFTFKLMLHARRARYLRRFTPHRKTLRADSISFSSSPDAIIYGLSRAVKAMEIELEQAGLNDRPPIWTIGLQGKLLSRMRELSG